MKRNFAKNKLLLLMGTIFMSPIVLAAGAFNIVPERPLPTTVPENGTVDAFYRVTNNLVWNQIKVSVKNLPLNVKQVVDGNPRTCKIVTPILYTVPILNSCILRLRISGPVNPDDPTHFLEVCSELPGGCSGTKQKLDVTVAPTPVTALVAAGKQFVSAAESNAVFSPLLVHSSGAIDDWRKVIDIDGISPDDTGEFLGANCEQGSQSTICTIGGLLKGKPPLLVQKINDEKWQVKSIEGIDQKTRGRIFTTSCSQNSSTICVAAGNTTVPGSEPAPLLAQSLDGGMTWSKVTSISGLPPTGSFYGSSCNINGSNQAVCIAVGADTASVPGQAIIARTINGGADWSVQSTSYAGSFFSASCTDNGAFTTCTAAGIGNGKPLLAVSTDGAVTWNINPFTLNPPVSSGQFVGTSCAGSAANTAVCTAVGLDYSTGLPLLIMSQNGGTTWTQETIKGLEEKTNLVGTTCRLSDVTNTVSCVATGNIIGGSPVIAGINIGFYPDIWERKEIEGLTAKIGSFVSTNCNYSTICIAAGYADSSTPDAKAAPLLAETKDLGVTWKVVKNIQDLPADAKGSFKATGAAGSTSGGGPDDAVAKKSAS